METISIPVIEPVRPIEEVAREIGAQIQAERTDNNGDNESLKRRRGRPPGSKNKPKGPAEPSPEQVAERRAAAVTEWTPLVFEGVRILIDRRYPNRPYTMEEARQLTAALIPVAEKYSSIVGQYSAEFTLASVVLIQVLGRERERQIQASEHA